MISSRASRLKHSFEKWAWIHFAHNWVVKAPRHKLGSQTPMAAPSSQELPKYGRKEIRAHADKKFTHEFSLNFKT